MPSSTRHPLARARFRPGWVLAAIVLPLAAWLGYSQGERRLEPEVQRHLVAPPSPLADAENLFLAILAFPIEGQEPAWQRGRAALEAYEQAAEAGRAPESYAQALGRHTAVFDDRQVRPCSAGNQPGAYACTRFSREDRTALQGLAAQIAPLLERYRELSDYPAYVDPRTPTVEIPDWDVTVLRIGLLQLSMLAWAVDDGRIREALDTLTWSAASWRRVLAAREVGLIHHTMALRLLAAHLLLASEWLARLPAGQDLPLDELLRPLTPAERSIEGPLIQEFRMQAALWQRLGDPDDPIVRKDFPDAGAWWYPMLMKPNDTIGRSHRDLQSLLDLESRGCQAVAQAFASAQAEPRQSGPAWYEYFYNPVGRVLQGLTGGPQTQLIHLGRACNLDALMQMVSLQRELKRRGVPSEDTARQVRELADRYADPNSGGPFGYDADNHRLRFAFIGPHLEPAAELPLDPVQ